MSAEKGCLDTKAGRLAKISRVHRQTNEERKKLFIKTPIACLLCRVSVCFFQQGALRLASTPTTYAPFLASLDWDPKPGVKSLGPGHNSTCSNFLPGWLGSPPLRDCGRGQYNRVVVEEKATHCARARVRVPRATSTLYKSKLSALPLPLHLRSCPAPAPETLACLHRTSPSLPLGHFSPVHHTSPARFLSPVDDHTPSTWAPFSSVQSDIFQVGRFPLHHFPR